MTKLALESGMALSDSRRRLRGSGVWAPSLSTDGVVAASSTRVTATATADAVPHTKGLWTEVVAATTRDISIIGIEAGGTSTAATNTSTLLDIGVGASLSEVVIVPNLAIGYAWSGYRLPVWVPKGSRIAIRCQSAVTVKQVFLFMFLFELPFSRKPASRIVDIGTNLATSHGVVIGAPGAANTKTSWVEIVAATAEPYEALMLGLQGAADTTLGAAEGLVDVGVGAAASERIVVADFPILTGASETVQPRLNHLCPAAIPAGSRLAVRWQSASTTGGLDAILYGAPQT